MRHNKIQAKIKNLKQITYHSLLLNILIGLLVVGCSSQKTNTANNHSQNLAKESHIVILSKDAQQALEEDETEQDLWKHIQQGFKLQSLYSNNDPKIQKEKKFFTHNTKATQRLLANGSPYLHYIVSELDKRGLPLELALLPAIESGYDPFAHSSQKAAGLWQFMPITAKHFKLQKNQWYDARLDVIESTNAALNYLEYLHKTFNDWPLALAAYNAGEGTVRKAIRKNKQHNLPTDYWHLSLPPQTTVYVPRLLALSSIIAKPESHKLQLQPLVNKPYFEAITLNKQIRLSTFAKVANIDYQEIKKLNAGFKQNTIIKGTPQQIIIPKHKVKEIQQLIADNRIRDEKVSFVVKYKIQPGDTLGGIAYRHRINVKKLLLLNNISKDHVLRIGKTLKIPSINTDNSPIQQEEGIAKN